MARRIRLDRQKVSGYFNKGTKKSLKELVLTDEHLVTLKDIVDTVCVHSCLRLVFFFNFRSKNSAIYQLIPHKRPFFLYFLLILLTKSISVKLSIFFCLILEFRYFVQLVASF